MHDTDLKRSLLYKKFKKKIDSHVLYSCNQQTLWVVSIFMKPKVIHIHIFGKEMNKVTLDQY
jgi:hypothetical protein